jgi:deoxyribonuclease-4
MLQNELLLGVHLSTSKGILGLFEEARRLKINVFQFFLGSPRVWRVRSIKEDEKEYFLNEKNNYKFIGAHAPYLLNFASLDNLLYRRSIDRAIEDIKEMEKLGIKYYIFHPGTNSDVSKGIKKIREAIKEILDKTMDIVLIVENTAGERNDIGKNLGELKEIVDGFQEKVGICIDTCHIFAYGNNLKDYDEVERLYINLIELKLDKLLKLIHANDSKFPLGQRRDRHAHIGEGLMGDEGFKNLFKHPFFRKLPYILETPKENDMDLVNLARLRKLWENNY